jgi:translation initiation factor 3 subunit B
MEPGYAIHTFAGAEVTKVAMDKLKQILWRPRPPTLLTRADQRKIKRNLREFAKQFEEADAAEESTVSKELLDQRKRLVDEWNAWRNRVKSKVEREREEMGRKPPGKLVDFSAKAQEVQTVEEWVDTIISETEEVVGMASDDN